MDGSNRMIFLGYGKYVRADRIYALEPIAREDRGGGRRTRVFVDGIVEPIVASRTERTILADMGQGEAVSIEAAEQALAFARDVVERVDSVGPLVRRSIKSEAGLDIDAIARRGRRLLARTTAGGDDRSPAPPTLFEDAD